MKKYVLLFLSLYSFSFIGKAQPPNYDDLTILYADGKFEKLIEECLKYNEKESTSKDPLPYLLLSKGYYGMSQKGDRGPEYKNAFKDAVSALGKFIKKDKTQSLIGENEEYIEMLKMAAAENVINEYEGKNYKKVSGAVSSYLKASPDNLGAKFLDGATKYMLNDKSTATAVWRDAEKAFLAMKDLGTTSEADVRIYKTGVLATAECLIKSKQTDRARALLKKAQDLIQEEDFKKQCNALL